VGNTAADSYFELVSCVAISSGDAPAVNVGAFAAADQSFIDSAYPVVLNSCFGFLKSNNIHHSSGGGGMFGSDTELVVNGGKYHSNIPADRSYTNAFGRFSFNDRIIIRN
jgi:hypothetical protein